MRLTSYVIKQVHARSRSLYSVVDKSFSLQLDDSFGGTHVVTKAVAQHADQSSAQTARSSKLGAQHVVPLGEWQTGQYNQGQRGQTVGRPVNKLPSTGLPPKRPPASDTSPATARAVSRRVSGGRAAPFAAPKVSPSDQPKERRTSADALTSSQAAMKHSYDLWGKNTDKKVMPAPPPPSATRAAASAASGNYTGAHAAHQQAAVYHGRVADQHQTRLNELQAAHRRIGGGGATFGKLEDRIRRHQEAVRLNKRAAEVHADAARHHAGLVNRASSQQSLPARKSFNRSWKGYYRIENGRVKCNFRSVTKAVGDTAHRLAQEAHAASANARRASLATTHAGARKRSILGRDAAHQALLHHRAQGTQPPPSSREARRARSRGGVTPESISESHESAANHHEAAARLHDNYLQRVPEANEESRSAHTRAAAANRDAAQAHRIVLDHLSGADEPPMKSQRHSVTKALAPDHPSQAAHEASKLAKAGSGWHYNNDNRALYAHNGAEEAAGKAAKAAEEGKIQEAIEAHKYAAASHDRMAKFHAGGATGAIDYLSPPKHRRNAAIKHAASIKPHQDAANAHRIAMDYLEGADEAPMKSHRSVTKSSAPQASRPPDLLRTPPSAASDLHTHTAANWYASLFNDLSDAGIEPPKHLTHAVDDELHRSGCAVDMDLETGVWHVYHNHSNSGYNGNAGGGIISKAPSRPMPEGHQPGDRYYVVPHDINSNISRVHSMRTGDPVTINWMGNEQAIHYVGVLNAASVRDKKFYNSVITKAKKAKKVKTQAHKLAEEAYNASEGALWVTEDAHKPSTMHEATRAYGDASRALEQHEAGKSNDAVKHHRLAVVNHQAAAERHDNLTSEDRSDKQSEGHRHAAAAHHNAAQIHGITLDHLEGADEGQSKSARCTIEKALHKVGDVWRGPSGRWFTRRRKDGRVVPARNPGAPEERGDAKRRVAEAVEQGQAVNTPRLHLRIDRTVRAAQELSRVKLAQAGSLKNMLVRHHGEAGAAVRAKEMTEAIFKALRELGKYDVHDKNKEMLRNRLHTKLQQLRSVLGDLHEGQQEGTEAADVGGADGSVAVQAQQEVSPLFRIITAREEHTGAADTGVVEEGLQRHLSNEQLIGTAKAIIALDTVGGFLLADGTGVGKSRQILAVAKTFAGRGKKVLIISPASVIKPNWAKNEVGGSFVKRDAEGNVIGGDAIEMGIHLQLNAGDRQLRAGQVSVTTYGSLEAIKDLVDSDTIVLFDEAHNLKNLGSQQSQHGMDMLKKAGGALYASATPADRAQDLAYLFRTEVFEGKTWPEIRRSLSPDVVGEEAAARNISSMFDRLTERGLMIKREISLEGIQVHLDRVELHPEQLASLSKITESVPSKDIGQAQMKQRFEQEKFKIPLAVKSIQEELKEGRHCTVFCAGLDSIAALRESLEKAGVSSADIGELHGGPASGGKGAVARFQSGKHRVLITTSQSGGPQPYSANVLTPNGWRTMGDLQVGDTVVAGDGSPTRIKDIFEQGVRAVYRVTTVSGASTRCTADHLWRVRRHSEKEWKTRSLQFLKGSKFRNWMLPVNGCVQFSEQDVPLDPYLLGLLLGDGSFRKGTPSFCNVSPHVIKSVEDIAETMGLKFTYQMEGTLFSGRFAAPFAAVGTRKITKKGWVIKKVSNTEWKHVGMPCVGDIPCGNRNILKSIISDLGLWGLSGKDKFVPESYLINSQEIRLKLLQGLMDTDGTVSQSGDGTAFCSKSDKLADSVIFLVRSLGGVASVARKSDGCYYVHVGMSVCPFRMPEKSDKWHLQPHERKKNNIRDICDDGEEQCRCLLLEHESHLYVTDDFVVTHNTGHNLDDTVGDKPRTQIIMTAPFSGIENSQIWGRVHRLTTKSLSRIRYLFADTQVDHWNAALVRLKVKALGAIVGGEVSKMNLPEVSEAEANAASPQFVQDKERAAQQARQERIAAKLNRLPEPGTIIRRPYKGRQLEVHVLQNHRGFQFEGREYPSLNRIAREVTGQKNINGMLFFGFGLKKPKQEVQSPETPKSLRWRIAKTLYRSPIYRIQYIRKGTRRGTCKPGQRADLTGCTPATGESIGEREAAERRAAKLRASGAATSSISAARITSSNKPAARPLPKIDKPSRRAVPSGKTAGARLEGKGKEQRVILEDGTPAPEHILPKMIGKDWTDVRIFLDPSSDVRVIARRKNPKTGRIEYKRTNSAEFSERNDGLKWTRTVEGLAKAPEMLAQIQRDKGSEEADCAWLMTMQATRLGGEADNKGLAKFYGQRLTPDDVRIVSETNKKQAHAVLTIGGEHVTLKDAGAVAQLKRAKKTGELHDTTYWLKSYGATTLEGRHIHVDGNTVSLRFMGKESVWHDHIIKDSGLASMLKQRAETAGPDGKLFATTAYRTSKYVAGLDGGKFTPKDLRTIRANQLATKAILGVNTKGMPRGPDECEAAIVEVAKKVSSVLGNGHEICREKYIMPAMWTAWQQSSGAKP